MEAQRGFVWRDRKGRIAKTKVKESSSSVSQNQIRVKCCTAKGEGSSRPHLSREDEELLQEQEHISGSECL